MIVSGAIVLLLATVIMITAFGAPVFARYRNAWQDLDFDDESIEMEVIGASPISLEARAAFIDHAACLDLPCGRGAPCPFLSRAENVLAFSVPKTGTRAYATA